MKIKSFWYLNIFHYNKTVCVCYQNIRIPIYNKTSKYINTTKIGHYQNMKIKLYLLSGFETPHSKSQSILGGMVYVTKSWRVTYCALIFTAFKDMVWILVYISKASTMSFRYHVVWEPLDILALEYLPLHHVLAWDGRPYKTTYCNQARLVCQLPQKAPHISSGITCNK